MTNELGNTTLESLGILTGIEGYRAALADPPNWQARLDGESQWLDYKDKLDNCWSVWDARMIVHDSVVQWRRKPDMKRDPMRYVVRPIELRDDMIVGELNGHFVDVNLRLPFAWNRRVASIAVEEIVDKPSDPSVEPPGSIITWQRAQERVDAGLAVETPVDLNEKRNEWAAVGSETIGSGTPAEYPHWTYRIPLQPAEAVKEAEAATMTAAEAMKYLLSGDNRCVLTSAGGSWTSAEVRAGSVGPIEQYEPYTPLIPAARSRVEMERKLENQRETITRLEAHLIRATQERDSALGSQKAAVAALEVEKTIVQRLRYVIAQMNRIVGNETAGKESG